MDINITDKVFNNLEGLTKTASANKDNLRKAKELISKLSNGTKVEGNSVLDVVQGLVNDIHSLTKREKIASLVGDMARFSQVDDYNIDDTITKLATYNDSQFEIEKRAFNLSIDSTINNSNLFEKVSGLGPVKPKKDLESFLT